MSDPIALARAAATPPQPVPLRSDGAVREPQASGSLHVRGRSPTRDAGGPGSIISRGSSPASSVRGASPPPALGSSPPVAPYQALPVRGPVITHNLTAGLPVLDPGKEPSEVRERRGGEGRAHDSRFCAGTEKQRARWGRTLSLPASVVASGWRRGVCAEHAGRGKGGRGTRGERGSTGGRRAAPRPMPGAWPHHNEKPTPHTHAQAFEARVRQVIDDYKAKLIERTEHHMG